MCWKTACLLDCKSVIGERHFSGAYVCVCVCNLLLCVLSVSSAATVLYAEVRFWGAMAGGLLCIRRLREEFQPSQVIGGEERALFTWNPTSFLGGSSGHLDCRPRRSGLLSPVMRNFRVRME